MERAEVFDGFVDLVEVMGSDLSVVNSARVSFGKRADSLRPRDERLIRYLWEHDHTSPFRHAALQFHLKAPLFVLRQWMKHQVGCAWNEISGRYVEFKPEFYRPEIWREQHEVNKQGSKGAILTQDGASQRYQQGLEQSFACYQELLEQGVCREQARMILPLSLYSECYWTVSLQALMHFLRLREDSHAQWEIQQYARAIRALAQSAFPVSLSLGQEDKSDEA